MRLTAVLPTLSVLPLALRGDSLTWHDGDVSACVIVADGRLAGLQRTIGGSAASVVADEAREAVPLLATLGADAWRFADAYGAAIASSRDPLAIRPARSPADAPVRTRRLVAAGIACSVALVIAIVGPTLMARHTAAQATAALSLLARQRRTAEAAESDLAHVSIALDEVAAFDRDRQPVTLLLDDLAHALPAGSALVTLRVDSAGGTLVALAPRAAALLERLEHLSSVSTPTFVGPVTREAAANAEVERVAIRFSRPRRSATVTASRRTP
jgi:Tfp pilus assembly protein PilN